MKRLKIGVVGSGPGRGQIWISTVLKLTDHFEMVGVCEAVPKRAEECAKKWKVRTFPNLPAMIEADKPDVILCAVPPDGNPVIGQMAARHGVNVISEIPIAPTKAIADSIKAACAENNVKIEIAENLHRWPRERLKRKIVEAGLIGDPQLARMWYATGSYHGFNVLRSILGCDAKRILGYRRKCDFDFVDEYMSLDLRYQRVSSAIIEFESGATCYFEQPPFGGTQFFYWEIEGTQGCLKGETLLLGRDDPQEYPFITETTSVNGVEVLDHIRVDTPEPIVFENPYKEYGVAQGDDQDEVARADILTGFYEALVNDKPVQYPPDMAWRDQEMVVALMESARLGSQWLDLPLQSETQVEKDMHDQYLELYGHPWHDIDSLIKSPLPRGGVRWAVLGDL